MPLSTVGILALPCSAHRTQTQWIELAWGRANRLKAEFGSYGRFLISAFDATLYLGFLTP